MIRPTAQISLLKVLILIFLMFTSINADSHQKGQATYLANEGVMVEAGAHKILFDPFFHNDYGSYQLVPDYILSAIKNNEPPYNDISAIFVSHAHGDHFAAEDMLRYLQKYPKVILIAPSQAIEKMAPFDGFEDVEHRFTSIKLAHGDTPVSMIIEDLVIEAVRIPHAGWPGRADVSNIVFRVGIPTENTWSTFVHMGDADPNDDHFRPFVSFWKKTKPDIAFPPYWFFLTIQGNYILDTHVNAETNIGVHVPVKVPSKLKDSAKLYFTLPGQKIETIHQH